MNDDSIFSLFVGWEKGAGDVCCAFISYREGEDVIDKAWRGPNGNESFLMDFVYV